MILGITGHRLDPHLGGYKTPNQKYNAVYDIVKSKIQEINPSCILSGMANGSDQIAVEIALILSIPFWAIVPCDNQDLLWPKEAKRNYQKLLSKAAKVVNVSPGPYNPSKMHVRDKWIVENSNELLAVWNGQTFGGTYSTVRSAEKKILQDNSYKIHIIDPSKL